MRPQKLNYLLNLAIQDKLETGDGSKLKKLTPQMEKLWYKFSKEEEDFRSGEEYQSYDDNETVYNQLMYISDRWKCAIRLKWIIDGVEKGVL